MSRHYLDHASASPARPEVVEAMVPWLTGERAGDPGRVHTEGRMARAALEDAREAVAALLGARPREVVFTSGGTEAANTAVWMATSASPGAACVAAAVEHSSVRDACARAGRVIAPAVDRLGRVTLDSLQTAMSAAGARSGPGNAVAVVNIQWANHEVATVQPVNQIVAWCRSEGILTHVDACAAAGHVPIDFAASGADLMSVSAAKLGGPKGIGALLIRRGLRLPPLIVGGEQERARRAGLENVPAAVGFGAAARALLDGDRLHTESAAARRFTDRLIDAALSIGGVVAYGDPAERVPHIVCVGVDDVEAEAVLLGLDQAGVAAHSGSACSSESLEPSPVLQAMGVEAERSLRLSTGWSTTDEDVAAACAAMPAVVSRLRSLRSTS